MHTTDLLLRVPAVGRPLLNAKAALWELLGRASIPSLDRLPDLPRPLHHKVRRLWTLLIGGRVDHEDQLFGMMRFAERVALLRYAAKVRRGLSAVELGAHAGVSSCFLTAGLRYAGAKCLWAIDTFEGTTTVEIDKESYTHTAAAAGGSVLPQFRRNLAMVGLSGLVLEKRGRTTELAKTWPGDPIGLLLVDADHSYEACRADFATWEPHLADDAIIMFHDHEPAYPGVVRVVDGLLAAGRLRHVETVCTLKICQYRGARVTARATAT